MKELYCLRCGSSGLTHIGSSGTYRCQYCGAVLIDDSLEKQAQTIRAQFGEVLAELRAKDIGAARQNLFAALNEKYLSSRKVVDCCCEIKKYLPEDFQANAFEKLNRGDIRSANKFLDGIDVNGEARYYIKDILDFMLKSMTSSNLRSLKWLADRALSGDEKTRYITAIEEEAQKYDSGVYDVEVPRDVFLAHSSMDMAKVNEIANSLNSSGISCFVSPYNLRHGKRSTEDYGKLLERAMHNCKCFVFLSSRNSRRLDCDAITVEVPYIKDHEPQVKRIEYIVDDYSAEEGAVKRILKDFFGESEQCRDVDDLIVRIHSALVKPAKPAVKYCLNCGAENPSRAKFCVECGKDKFADSIKDYLDSQRKRIEQQLTEQYANARNYPTLDNYDKSSFEIEGTVLKKYLGKDTSVKIPHGVAEIGEESFYNRKDVTSVEIPNSVTSIGADAFGYCKGLMNINIPNNVTSIGRGAFRNCEGLTSINIPNGVASIGANAFYGCKGLTSITIPKSVTSIAYGILSGCSGLASLSVEEGNPVCYSKNNCIIARKTNTLAFGCKNSIIPDGVTAIGDCAFSGCKELTNITIPNSVTSIGADAFRDCEGLTDIKIPNSVTSIRHGAFNGCEGLTDIKIPEEVTSIDDFTFSCCCGLTSIKIPNGVTTIGDWAFENSYNITSIEIPGGVTSIGTEAFYGCDGLTDIKIPNSVTSIGKSIFAACESLTKIIVDKDNPVYRSENNCIIEVATNTVIAGCKTSIIPKGVTAIGDGAFSNAYCTNITIPEGVTSIGEGAFEYSALKNITLPDGLISIGSGAFGSMDSLESIVIPISVAEMGDAFDGCKKLKIYCEAQSQPEGWNENWNPDNHPVTWWGFTPEKISNADAQELNAIALHYYKANDYQRAVKLFSKAAEKGSVIALSNLGACYANGQGVEQSYAEAAKWYRKAADQGNEQAKIALERLKGRY